MNEISVQFDLFWYCLTESMMQNDFSTTVDRITFPLLLQEIGVMIGLRIFDGGGLTSGDQTSDAMLHKFLPRMILK
jgi:hypothetical protein